jgi:hypothetical protein
LEVFDIGPPWLCTETQPHNNTLAELPCKEWLNSFAIHDVTTIEI